MKNDMDLLKKRLKGNIQKLIDSGDLKDARQLVEQYKDIDSDDVEVYSMDAVILIMENKFDEAEEVLREGLDIDENNFNLNYNFGCVYKQNQNFEKAFWYYKKALDNCSDKNMVSYIDKLIREIKSKHNISTIVDKKKIVFFDKGDDKFIWDIINELSEEYETKHIRVTNYRQIDEGMKWADICWFEWCDELVGYGSKLPIAKEKKIICRIHGYEVYFDFIRKPNWKNVDDLIIVAPHIRRMFEENTKDIDKRNLRIHTIFCGINLDRYPLNIKKKGYNLGYLGYINFKKNIPLTLDIFKKLHDIDSRYKLYIAGQFQDARTLAYFQYFIKEYKLDKSVVFEGWQNEKQKIEWFKKIDYMVISSIDEGLCFAAAESMASGIKPILHNCEGIKDHYNKKYIFNSADEAVKMITEEKYDSREYRKFIQDKYSLDKENFYITKVLDRLNEGELK